MELPADRSPHHRIKLAAIRAARAQIPAEFQNSPQFECEPLSAALNCRLMLKVETANPIRNFKGRGASVLVAEIIANASSGKRPFVGASAGNWGQALAYACRAANWPLIMFASINANPLKVERMRALGADLRLAGEDFDASKLAAEAYAKAEGLRMVADGLDVEASIGAGTIGLELAQGAPLDAVLVPLGNGAMLTGIGRWIKSASPSTKIYGISAAGADAMEKSWRGGSIIERASVSTIADGIGVRIPIPEAVSDMKDTVDDVLLVSEDAIRHGMKLLFQHAGLIAEPSGAAGVAALIEHASHFRNARVATPICGGNVTPEQARAWFI